MGFTEADKRRCCRRRKCQGKTQECGGGGKDSATMGHPGAIGERERPMLTSSSSAAGTTLSTPQALSRSLSESSQPRVQSSYSHLTKELAWRGQASVLVPSQGWGTPSRAEEMKAACPCRLQDKKHDGVRPLGSRARG